jgi:DNA (cytosine-5)-methyltransferase 1
MRALGVTPQIPAEVLDLEDPSLLYMEMSEAAEHFGVIAPSGRRDRKSGAKKRKQHDIEAARLQLLKKRA